MVKKKQTVKDSLYSSDSKVVNYNFTVCLINSQKPHDTQLTVVCDIETSANPRTEKLSPDRVWLVCSACDSNN